LCFGSNIYGQIGNGTEHNFVYAPTAVLDERHATRFTGVVALTAGDYHVCAEKADTSVWCWGYNSSGQLGRNSPSPFGHPYPGEVLFVP
jgi:alpha-tubulin suppressor-like RCC1 family protein